MADIEIEAPTTEQKAQAYMGDILALSATGASEHEIVMKLMAKGVSRDEAEAILPEILEKTRGARRRRWIIRKGCGAVLTATGLGLGIYSLTQGVLVIWFFVIAVLGLALFTGYIDSVVDIFMDRD